MFSLFEESLLFSSKQFYIDPEKSFDKFNLDKSIPFTYNLGWDAFDGYWFTYLKMLGCKTYVWSRLYKYDQFLLKHKSKTY